MTKKEAPHNGANESKDVTAVSTVYRESSTSQCLRIIEHLKQYSTLSTIDAREKLGIMHPAMRICELRRAGAPIHTSTLWQADTTGASHKVAVYIWRGNQVERDLFGDKFDLESKGTV